MRTLAALTAAATSAAAVVIMAASVPAIAAYHSLAMSHPSATFSFLRDKINADTKPKLKYSTAHLPSAAKVYLQRQFGSAQVWKNVKPLKPPSGTVSAPAVPMGQYAYRIRVTHQGKPVATSVVHSLYAYGTVSYATLCKVDNVGCANGTLQVGNSVFTYAQEISGTVTYPNYTQILKLNSTSCSHITVSWAAQDTKNGDTSYTEIVQSTIDPQLSSAPSNTIGTLPAKLDGGPFILNGATTDGNAMFFNGSAHCYTATGLP